jgi:hypothetical protein
MSSESSESPSSPSEQPQPIEENSEKVFIVYKFMNTPIDAIIAGM